ncbi:hypothetical protein BaRGS_00031828 [Batillaria attramentaria]|uniref:C1q domain-containing protein n=1 Tax=Batillaria attramentaria TaxID=370345 RepID=A0ABD0JQC8_9CAEN
MGSGMVPVHFMTLILAMVVMVQVTSTLAFNRGRRSDDYGALDVVVNGLSEKLTQLTAQLQALDTKLTNQNQAQDTKITNQEAEITSLKNQLNNQIESRLDLLEQPVVFTVMFKSYHITGLGSTMVHGDHGDDNLELAMLKGTTVIANAYACCSNNARTSQTITVHLNHGDTVHVQVVHGTELYGGRHTSFTGIKLSPK